MRFTNTVVLALAGSAVANPIAAPNSAVLSGAAIDARDEALEKRLEPITMAILTTAGTTAASVLVTKAINGIESAIKALSNFDSAREEFTKSVSQSMWSGADQKAYQAAICYNMGYEVKDPAAIDGLTSAELKSGLLHVDFDCFLLKSGANTFVGKGDGGFQNLAISHDSRCTYDSKSITLTCK